MRGITLVELLVAMVVVAILGTALVRMLINNSRFVNQQDAMLDARLTARAAMNTMAPELRMVSDGGLQASTTAKKAVVRVPYAFGMTCQTSAGAVVASVVPTDSAMFASATPSGIAWRVDSTYQFASGITVASSSEQSACDADSIRVLTGGKRIAVTTAATIPSGSVFYLYQTVTFEFAPSAQLPGRVGLWRQAGSAANEELISPFDTAAGFGFLVGASLEPVDAPPADLSTVRGLELKLVGLSQVAVQGDTVPRKFDLRTRIPFMNSIR